MDSKKGQDLTRASRDLRRLSRNMSTLTLETMADPTNASRIKSQQLRRLSRNMSNLTLGTTIDPPNASKQQRALVGPEVKSDTLTNSTSRYGDDSTNTQARLILRDKAQEQFQAARKQRKQTLRRRRMLHQVHQTQTSAPTNISLYDDLLPDFDWLEIADQPQTATSSDLTGIETMDTSTENNNLDSPRNHLPQDNLPCYQITCPIDIPHNEGPYYHNGVLGDQDHPKFCGSTPPESVWEAYWRELAGCGTRSDEDVVDFFVLWHVPPFLPYEGNLGFVVTKERI